MERARRLSKNYKGLMMTEERRLPERESVREQVQEPGVSAEASAEAIECEEGDLSLTLRSHHCGQFPSTQNAT